MFQHFCLKAVPVEKELQGIPFAQYFDHKSGYTGSFPSCMICDTKGRYWVASDHGDLFTGDGNRFLEVDLPEWLKNSKIKDLGFEPTDRIWVLSTSGLASLYKGEWFKYPEVWVDPSEKNIPDQNFRIVQSPGGQVAIKVGNSVWQTRPDGTLIAVEVPKEASSGQLILAWSKESLVISNGASYWIRAGQDWESLPDPEIGAKEKKLDPLHYDSLGFIYRFTTEGMYFIAPGSRVWEKSPEFISELYQRTRSLNDGKVCILQDKQILMVYGAKADLFSLPQHLSSYAAKPICLDSENNLWLASFTLIRIPMIGLLSSHSGPERLPEIEIWKIARSPEKDLWVCTDQGLYVLRNQVWERVVGVPGCYSIGFHSDGFAYVTATMGWIYRVRRSSLEAVKFSVILGGKEIQIRKGPLITGDKLYALSMENDLLSGTQDGKSWSWMKVVIPGVPADNKPVDLYLDEIGRPWVIHMDRAECFNGTGWELVEGQFNSGLTDLTFRKPDSGYAVQYSPPLVYQISRDSGHWTMKEAYSFNPVLKVSITYSIRQHMDGSVWVGTDKGVFRIDMRQPDQILHFDKESGLNADDTNQGAMFLENDGNLWIGTPLGLNNIQSNQIIRKLSTDKPFLLMVGCGQRRYFNPDSLLEMSFHEGLVTIEMGVAGYQTSHDGFFEFRENNSNWIRVSGASLQFPELKAGLNHFDFRTVSKSGSVSPVQSVRIEVETPWYLRTWAYPIYLLLIFIITWMGFRRRLVLLEKRNQKLTQAVKEATEELRESRDHLEIKVMERTRELEAYFRLSQISEQKEITIEEILERFTNVLPLSWSLPDQAGARIIYNSKVFRSPDFEVTPWLLSEEIPINNSEPGRMEVSYRSHPRAGIDSDLFLPEEKQLLHDLALKIGNLIELKNAEQNLIHAKERAEASDKLKAAFLNTISHEIRTPLNGILGFGEIMMDPDLSEEDRMNAFNILNRSCDRLMNTITNIIESSMLVTGTIQPHFSDVNLNELFIGLLKAYGDTARQKSMDLRLEIPERDSVTLNSDGVLLKKVLSHLIENAIKFSDSGIIATGYNPKDSSVEFFVKDQGIGISPELLEEILKHFNREEQTLTQKYSGTGLGLSIANGIIRLLGGELIITSAKNEGSEFRFIIPQH